MPIRLLVYSTRPTTLLAIASTRNPGLHVCVSVQLVELSIAPTDSAQLDSGANFVFQPRHYNMCYRHFNLAAI